MLSADSYLLTGDHLVSVNDKPITNDTVTDVLQGLSGTDKVSSLLSLTDCLPFSPYI